MITYDEAICLLEMLHNPNRSEEEKEFAYLRLREILDALLR